MHALRKSETNIESPLIEFNIGSFAMKNLAPIQMDAFVFRVRVLACYMCSSSHFGPGTNTLVPSIPSWQERIQLFYPYITSIYTLAITCSCSLTIIPLIFLIIYNKSNIFINTHMEKYHFSIA